MIKANLIKKPQHYICNLGGNCTALAGHSNSAAYKFGQQRDTALRLAF